jgi:hypothetical protein
MTRRAALYCVVLVYSLILVGPLAHVSVAEGEKKLATHTVVAASGGAAPAGGSYMTFFRVALNMLSRWWQAAPGSLVVCGQHEAATVIVRRDRWTRDRP